MWGEGAQRSAEARASVQGPVRDPFGPAAEERLGLAAPRWLVPIRLEHAVSTVTWSVLAGVAVTMNLLLGSTWSWALGIGFALWSVLINWVVTRRQAEASEPRPLDPDPGAPVARSRAIVGVATASCLVLAAIYALMAATVDEPEVVLAIGLGSTVAGALSSAIHWVRTRRKEDRDAITLIRASGWGLRIDGRRPSYAERIAILGTIYAQPVAAAEQDTSAAPAEDATHA